MNWLTKPRYSPLEIILGATVAWAVFFLFSCSSLPNGPYDPYQPQNGACMTSQGGLNGYCGGGR